MGYPKPPITEAIVDIKTFSPSSVALESLKQMQPSDYPERKEVWAEQGTLQLISQPISPPDKKLLGYTFQTVDGKQLFQARIDGFTLSRLFPYEGWEAFKPEAQKLWTLYKSIVSPQAITRIGLRYVNRIDLPVPVNDLKIYLRTCPEVSSDMSQIIQSFFMQLQSPQIDIDAMLVLHQAVIPPPSVEFASVLLDIDLVKYGDLPIGEEQLWAHFDQLRERKNKIFEACITESTRRLFY